MAPSAIRRQASKATYPCQLIEALGKAHLGRYGNWDGYPPNPPCTWCGCGLGSGQPCANTCFGFCGYNCKLIEAATKLNGGKEPERLDELLDVPDEILRKLHAFRGEDGILAECMIKYRPRLSNSHFSNIAPLEGFPDELNDFSYIPSRISEIAVQLDAVANFDVPEEHVDVDDAVVALLVAAGRAFDEHTSKFMQAEASFRLLAAMYATLEVVDSSSLVHGTLPGIEKANALAASSGCARKQWLNFLPHDSPAWQKVMAAAKVRGVWHNPAFSVGGAMPFILTTDWPQTVCSIMTETAHIMSIDAGLCFAAPNKHLEPDGSFTAIENVRRSAPNTPARWMAECHALGSVYQAAKQTLERCHGRFQQVRRRLHENIGLLSYLWLWDVGLQSCLFTNGADYTPSWAASIRAINDIVDYVNDAVQGEVVSTVLLGCDAGLTLMQSLDVSDAMAMSVMGNDEKVVFAESGVLSFVGWHQCAGRYRVYNKWAAIRLGDVPTVQCHSRECMMAKSHRFDKEGYIAAGTMPCGCAAGCRPSGLDHISCANYQSIEAAIGAGAQPQSARGRELVDLQEAWLSGATELNLEADLRMNELSAAVMMYSTVHDRAEGARIARRTCILWAWRFKAYMLIGQLGSGTPVESLADDGRTTWEMFDKEAMKSANSSF